MGRRDLTIEDIEKAMRGVYAPGELEFLRKKNAETAERLAKIIDALEYPYVPESVRQLIRDLERSEFNKKCE